MILVVDEEAVTVYFSEEIIQEYYHENSGSGKIASFIRNQGCRVANHEIYVAS